ncbi:hypothetical protein FNO01nite_27380 [Flavobacterium noncentrifugens]|uniref:DUF4199 domain-containing protein n=1 Tax=Flavobacterium noncentrifugens TaxID=1128970 RepID=A0A1G9CKG7_9FLAO|nr:DUF4199 domain-containing protein [Flavobacterium noncentrifugens]GEP52066.1 hypothetical protein FNO01nite_27380 [Flavobacterium noncentrifugens]SDK52086.1 Protein of unknown function [Flavobacterium noncentrifugens]
MENLRKNAVKFGLFLGLFLIVVTTIMYAVDLSLFTKPWIGVTNLIVITLFGAFAGITYKKQQGGFLTFKEAFTAFFITVVIGFLLSTIYTILLFNFIDPEAKAVITENLIKYTVSMMQSFGAKAADVNKIIEDLQKTDSFGAVAQLKGFAINLVIYSIIGLVTALIIRRERPQSL